MDYKQTLILPQTTFPMRGNLPQNESARYAKWQQHNVYETMKNNRKDAQKAFNLHDGPPYANGDLHIGHALNKILKDIITKIHYFKGESIRYLPGWDCHGLPIEQQIEKKLSKEKKDSMHKNDIRKLCAEHATHFIQQQKKGFLELGVIGDFKNAYETMDFKFEADIYRCLCQLALKGLLCEREKPVYWSWACQTALAEAEVEYKDKQSDSIFVAFPLSQQALHILDAQQASLVIWTTTPWTLPANLAVALAPNAPYILSSDGKIVAKVLYEKCKQEGIIHGTIQKTFNSSVLENALAINPLNQRESRIILAPHVLLEEGSGCVHTAPGHGEDDYNISLQYNLGVLMPVDDYGCFDNTIKTHALLPSSFIGMHIFKAQPLILELLGSSLLKHTVITHSYPHCWRSNKPVIFRATKQWFIMMDKPFIENKTLRQIALEELKKVQFYPSHGIKRIGSMIENRPDWCISRQRDWGVPLAFLRDKTTKEPLLEAEVLEHIAHIFQEQGCNAWWSEDVATFLPQNYKHRAQKVEKIQHILDVWFDSGSTWAAVLQNKHYDAGAYPASLYLEGSDQHRGWFHSSLLISTALNQKAPYKALLTHGFTMDKNGEKMSKSKGNVILPSQITKEFGSEILRLWVAMSDYQNDQNISLEILKQTSEAYKKIRNTLRFLLANTNDLLALNMQKLSPIDCWILNHSQNIFDQAHKALCDYELSKAMQLLNHFIINELSGIYMDITKDILYCDAQSSQRRQAIQSTMALIAQKLFELLAPILTYTIDEALEHVQGYLKSINNNVFALLYTPIPFKVPLQYDFKDLLEIRSLFLEHIDILKKQGQIKSTLETSIYTKTNELTHLIPLWLMVSEAGDIQHKGVLSHFIYKGTTFEIVQAHQYKCERCWQYLAPAQGKLCKRCADVLEGQNV